MPKPLTRYHAIDLKTNITYGFDLDAKGNCVAIQPMRTVIRNKEDEDSVVFDPINAPLPFGKTITAVEMNGNFVGQIFTMVWPTEAAFEKGARPQITKKFLPGDFVRAGIAAPPRPTPGGPGKPEPDMDAALAEAMKTIDSMIGLDSAKRDIKQNIAVARFNKVKEELGIATNPISRHMVFTGNPGTGKTTFAREVAKVYKALGFIKKDTVHEVKREDLVAGYVGQTALKTKEAITKAKGGVLFIDEAYALSRLADSPGGSNDFGREAIDTLVAAMENMRDDLVVIVAGYEEPMKKFIDANEGLKSRFMTYIKFEDYTAMQLGEILDVMIKDRGYTLEPEARAHAMSLLEKEKKRVQPKDFGNGRVVRNLVEKAEKELAERLEKEGALSTGHGGLTQPELRKALTTLTLADLKGVSLDSLTAPGGSGGFDFGGKKQQLPANDTKSSPSASAAPKKSAKNHFRP
jgi:AAA+ superfamily predicted ATPase